MTEYPELEKLKADNEALREQGKEWLFTSLEKICAEINTELTPKAPEPVTPPPEPALQVGTQDWQFETGDSINKSLMIGERIGIRHKGKTLTVEVGWPRKTEDGFVPDAGLARARVSLSANVFIDAILLAELTLRKDRDSGEISWQLLSGEKISEEGLRSYIERVMMD